MILVVLADLSRMRETVDIELGVTRTPGDIRQNELAGVTHGSEGWNFC
jgi:hypothetical protein